METEVLDKQVEQRTKVENWFEETKNDLEATKEEINNLKKQKKCAFSRARKEAIQTQIETLKYRKSRIQEMVNLHEHVGAIPMPIPQGWYVGLVEEISREDLDKLPNRFIDTLHHTSEGYSVYVGDMPPHVVKIYKETKWLVPKSRIVVASPDKDSFRDFRISPDPMLFVYIPTFGIWMRLAVWDLSKDLKEVK